MKVYIFGLGPSRLAVPPSVPGWETWGLPWDDGRAVHYDRCFEMHDLEMVKLPGVRARDYFAKLPEMRRLYVQDPEGWPAGERYPLEDVVSEVGDYFASSMSYMLGLAILERVSALSLYGVELHDGDAFAHERPNIEYFLGFARARGIAVEVSPTSAVFDRRVWQELGKHRIRYPVRYGYV